MLSSGRRCATSAPPSCSLGARALERVQPADERGDAEQDRATLVAVAFPVAEGIARAAEDATTEERDVAPRRGQVLKQSLYGFHLLRRLRRERSLCSDDAENARRGPERALQPGEHRGGRVQPFALFGVFEAVIEVAALSRRERARAVNQVPEAGGELRVGDRGLQRVQDCRLDLLVVELDERSRRAKRQQGEHEPQRRVLPAAQERVRELLLAELAQACDVRPPIPETREQPLGNDHARRAEQARRRQHERPREARKLARELRAS